MKNPAVLDSNENEKMIFIQVKDVNESPEKTLVIEK
jgi:hypothetical protein